MILLLLALCIFETISRVFCPLMVNILEVNLFSFQLVNWMTSESIVRESDHKIHNTIIYNKYLNAGIKNFPRQKNEVNSYTLLSVVSRATTLVIRYESILEPLISTRATLSLCLLRTCDLLLFCSYFRNSNC